MIPIGGQAVIEGVLVKSKNHSCIAVRKENGKITVKREKLKPIGERYKILNLFFIRGVVNLIEMIYTGMKALSYSAKESGNDDEKMNDSEVYITMITSLFFAVVLFVVVPFYLTKLIAGNGPWFNLVDGLVRLMILLVYIVVISRLKDVKRLFEYHGAEHMAVACYENKKTLNYNNVRRFSPEHPRCGTNFLFMVFIVSIIVFSFVTGENWTLKLAIRILLLPIIAGISYEILKISGKYHERSFFKIINYPGILLQKLTTKRPDRKQIEVAIAALKGLLKAESSS